MTQYQTVRSINVDLGCDGNCEDCEKYFVCNLHQRKEDLFVGRLARIPKTLEGVKHKILIIGGKGGVGKTLLAANFATALAMLGRRVSILDQVFDGPCIPRMMGVEGQGIQLDGDILVPVEGLLNIQVVSMGLILDEQDVITWFGDMKKNATEEFLTMVGYGERDYLIIDVPAGTSADTTNVLKLVPELDGALIVTIPSQVSQAVAYKGAMLCRQAGLDIFGVVENTSGLTCSACGRKINVFQEGGGRKLAKLLEVPFLMEIPMDRRIADSADEGDPFVHKYPDWEPSKQMLEVARQIDRKLQETNGGTNLLC
ncbi:Iron-sulfur cluster carrier protein [subsurface metagenome]